MVRRDFFAVSIFISITKSFVVVPGLLLHKKFEAIGEIRGKSKNEIIAKVGRPTSISALPDGKTLLQW